MEAAKVMANFIAVNARKNEQRVSKMLVLEALSEKMHGHGCGSYMQEAARIANWKSVLRLALAQQAEDDRFQLEKEMFS